mmetsp:Transcript_15415/g.33945  ORF Transcript_15415/g.33945 Transcript_15415/m.33945 type:complete len:249 (+) Transcript_15415:1652-2398(+)
MLLMPPYPIAWTAHYIAAVIAAHLLAAANLRAEDLLGRGAEHLSASATTSAVKRGALLAATTGAIVALAAARVTAALPGLGAELATQRHPVSAALALAYPTHEECGRSLTGAILCLAAGTSVAPGGRLARALAALPWVAETLTHVAPTVKAAPTDATAREGLLATKALLLTCTTVAPLLAHRCASRTRPSVALQVAVVFATCERLAACCPAGPPRDISASSRFTQLCSAMAGTGRSNRCATGARPRMA